MAILLQQDFAQSNDEKGPRAKVRPQDIKSGTYYGQLQLRGSILVIKDNLNTESGYLAFGSSMSTIPTSPTTGTGIYIDYRGIYGMSSGTPQFTLDASTGAITAISGTIGGWTITSTALSNAGGTVTMRGAGNLAFGATPPTSATVGTGIFVNNAGIYGLASNVQQFYLQASDGKAYFGGGGAYIGADGIVINANAGDFIQWQMNSTLISSIAATASSTTMSSIWYNTGIATYIEAYNAISVTNLAGTKTVGQIMDTSSTMYRLTLDDNTDSSLLDLTTTTLNFASDGAGINVSGNSGAGRLIVNGTAPELLLRDNTGSAKDLSIVVNANRVSFTEETAGSEILGLELASEAVRHNTYAITKTIQKTGIADNTATGVFTVTTTDETGNVDGGAFVCDVLALVSHIATAGAGNNAVKKYRGSFSREIISTATGTNTAVEDTFTGTSAASASATRDIGTITMDVVETSEYVQTVRFTVDLTGSSVQTAEVTCFITLLYTGFTTAPVIAAA
jgi:hypothetical protein